MSIARCGRRKHNVVALTATWTTFLWPIMLKNAVIYTMDVQKIYHWVVETGTCDRHEGNGDIL